VVGALEGADDVVGCRDGLVEGTSVGVLVGVEEGDALGCNDVVGLTVGTSLGIVLGLAEGTSLGG